MYQVKIERVENGKVTDSKEYALQNIIVDAGLTSMIVDADSATFDQFTRGFERSFLAVCYRKKSGMLVDKKTPCPQDCFDVRVSDNSSNKSDAPKVENITTFPRLECDVVLPQSIIVIAVDAVKDATDAAGVVDELKLITFVDSIKKKYGMIAYNQIRMAITTLL